MDDKNIFNSIKELEKGIVRKIMSETSHDEMFSKPSIAQMQIIKYILKHDGKTIYQRDLEEVFNLRRATISGILKTMEKNNVIIRVCDPNDARGKIVILSDDAKKFFKEKETLFKKAEAFALLKGNRAPRIARQFLMAYQANTLN